MGCFTVCCALLHPLCCDLRRREDELVALRRSLGDRMVKQREMLLAAREADLQALMRKQEAALAAEQVRGPVHVHVQGREGDFKQTGSDQHLHARHPCKALFVCPHVLPA